MSLLWSIQDSELSKTDLKIFWYILLDVQKQMAADTPEDQDLPPFINFDIDVNSVSKLSSVAIPNIHRTLRKLEKSFLLKREGKYSLKLKSR